MDSILIIIVVLALLWIRYKLYIWTIKQNYEDFIKVLKTNWLKAKIEKRYFKKRLLEKKEKARD